MHQINSPGREVNFVYYFPNHLPGELYAQIEAFHKPKMKSTNLGSAFGIGKCS